MNKSESGDIFKDLYEPGAEIDKEIEALATHVHEIKPEEIIKHAIKLESVHALQLMSLLSKTEQTPDLSNLSIQSENIDNAGVKITLLSYLGDIDQLEAPLLISEFLKDSNKAVVFEALKALHRQSISFDVSVLLPYLETMSASEQGLALKIITRQANTDLVEYLSSYLAGSSSKLNHFFAKIVVDHADEESFEKFLKRLSIEDEAVQCQTMACLEKFTNGNLAQLAGTLVGHDQIFICESAQQLSSNIFDDKDLEKIKQFALSENHQVRERAIYSLGRSANRASLSILKKVSRKWNEDSVLVLKAVKQLGFSKGLEIAFSCLDSNDAKTQRSALETIEAIITDKHAASARENILWKIPVLVEELKDYARSLVIKFSWDYGLPQIQVDENLTTSVGMTDMPIWREEVELEEEVYPQVESPLDELEPGTVWMDRYLIKKEIGRGAMGRVMLVTDDMVDELMILKFMSPELMVDNQSTARFKREVKYARRVGHKNVIRVHDLLSRDGLYAISMEYFKSRGLDTILKEIGAFASSDALKILYQISSGMAAAHEQRVIHRDLKPSNILIGESGLVKIVDFGVASARLASESTLTQTGSIIGSPAYLAPERTIDLDADERSDIYSLGIVAYFLVSGKLPYQGRLLELLEKHREGSATPVNKINQLVSPEIARLVSAMMAVEPADRPQSMISVRSEIKKLLDSR